MIFVYYLIDGVTHFDPPTYIYIYIYISRNNQNTLKPKHFILINKTKHLLTTLVVTGIMTDFCHWQTRTTSGIYRISHYKRNVRGRHC
jgi:hypothetical protein